MTTNVPQDVIDDLELLRAVLQGFQDCAPKSDGLAAYQRLKVYLAQRQQGSEPVAWQFFSDGKWHNGMDTNNHKQNTIDAGYPVRELYTTPPQANALVAAAYRDAAEIAAGLVSENKGTDFSAEIRIENQAFKIAAEEILAAIPKESADALKEYVRGKCEEVSHAVRMQALSGPVPADEIKAIVNSVLGEGGK